VSARIDSAGNVHQLDRPAEPDEILTEEDVQDAPKLARLLVRILKEVTTLRRRFWPRRTDFEDRTVSNGTDLRLTHRFNSRVRWWVVDWVAETPGNAPQFETSADTDLNTLVLVVWNNGKVTIRVEAAG
jgi:hypothetical protein